MNISTDHWVPGLSLRQGALIAAVASAFAALLAAFVAWRTWRTIKGQQDIVTLLQVYERISSTKSVEARRTLFWLWENKLIAMTADELTAGQEQILDEVILPLDMLAFTLRAKLIRPSKVIPFYYATVERAWKCVEPLHKSVREARDSRWAGDLEDLAHACRRWRDLGLLPHRFFALRPPLFLWAVARRWIYKQGIHRLGREGIPEPRIRVIHAPSNAAVFRADAEWRRRMIELGAVDRSASSPPSGPGGEGDDSGTRLFASLSALAKSAIHFRRAP